ncbi:MAG: hypothetical protein AAFP26_09945 [Planctomycetota bacterium]
MDNGAGAVAVVSGFAVLWEDVDDDGFGGADGAGAVCVAVGADGAWCDDVSVGCAVGLGEVGVDGGVDAFGGEDALCVVQDSLGVGLGVPDHLGGEADGALGGVLGGAEGLDLGG